jgi:hypothetical protein
MVDASSSPPGANEAVGAVTNRPCESEAPHASLLKAVAYGQSALATAMVRHTLPLIIWFPLLSSSYAIVMMIFLPSPVLTLGLIIGVNLFLNLQSFNKDWR